MQLGKAVLGTTAGSVPCRKGKVRDVYDLGDRLVLVATDRISAFDYILPNGIPDKGKILTQLSLFWFSFLGEENHLISTDLKDMGSEFAADAETFAGRSILCKKTSVIPIECVVRGYISGSGWKEYRKKQTICDQQLPGGMVESDKLAEPIFTPATKEESGHDENISVERMATIVGQQMTDELKRRSISIYQRGRDYAATKGIILADTKFEFGKLPDGKIILIDEVLTPDSSRFWPANQYKPGGGQPSYDKQFVRDWLESVGYDKESTPPPMPNEIIEKTRAKYVEAYERLSGKTFVA